MTNPTANVSFFGDIPHKDWVNYSGGTDRPGGTELCCNFSISDGLTQIVSFPTRIPDCDFHKPALLDLFISSDAIIYSAMVFPPLGNFDHVVLPQFPLTSCQTQMGCLVSLHSL